MADNPETVSVMSKPPLSAERLHKLALAREKALEMRRKNMQKNLQARLDKVNEDLAPVHASLGPVSESQTIAVHEDEQPVKDDDVPPPVQEDEISPPAVTSSKPVKKKKKAPVIVVEQDSDDSDDYDSNDRIIFVKRSKSKRQKKEVEQPPPPPQQPPPPQPPPPTPQQPELTAEQMQVRAMYNNMYSGNFLNQPFARRRF